jgi:phosphotransacetylase
LDTTRNIEIKCFDDLRKKLAAESPKTLVVAAAHDAHTLEAVSAAAKELPMKSILVGDREKILAILSDLGEAPDADAVVDCADGADCARLAVSLVREGRGDVLMKGMIETGTLLKAVLDKDAGIRDSGVMSHLAVLEVPHYHKLALITDGGILTNPTLEQKADIVRNAVAFCRNLGWDQPKVAALCAVEAVSKRMPETVEAAELQEMCLRGELGDCILEGPMSFDISTDPESARIKGYKSAISGDVDIFLVPNITVGNVLAKGLIHWGGAIMAGCVLGAKAPIVLVSRGASAQEKLLSIMLCLA